MGTHIRMKSFIFVLAFVAIAQCSPEQEWESFKIKYGKGFKSLVEETTRKAIFMENLNKVETHNAKFEAGLTTYKQGINQYSDMTWEEFKEVVLMKEQSSEQKNVHFSKRSLAKKNPNAKFESSKDWRSVMNPVKNQGHCGSCWAFGAIGVLEAAWYLAGNDKVVLSEQMLVDCGPGYGCDGGWTDYALDFLLNPEELKLKLIIHTLPVWMRKQEPASLTTLPLLLPSLTMTPSWFGMRVLMVLPNPSMITDLTQPICTPMTISCNMPVESLMMLLVLPIPITMLLSMLVMIPMLDTGLSATLGDQVGAKVDILEWLWAKILAMLKMMLGYLRSK